jgi:peroxiredoxin Q/BCP
MSNQVLQEGQPAPDIHLNDDQGNPFVLSGLKGKTVILFFYPKADTPGCTIEACEFRDSATKFSAADTVIVGVSPDGSSAQSAFKSKFDLPYALLADAEHKTAEDYGVWQPMTWDGKTFMAAARTTFLIGKDGVIRKIFSKVKPQGHAEEVYRALQSLET